VYQGSLLWRRSGQVNIHIVPETKSNASPKVMFSVTLSPLKPEKKTANPKGNISSKLVFIKFSLPM